MTDNQELKKIKNKELCEIISKCVDKYYKNKIMEIKLLLCNEISTSSIVNVFSALSLDNHIGFELLQEIENEIKVNDCLQTDINCLIEMIRNELSKSSLIFDEDYII